MKKKIPSILYKYYEVNDFIPKILSGESLKFSCPFDFNDPFESRSCYQIDNTKEGKRYIREAVSRRHKNPSKKIAETQRLIKRFSTPQPLEDDIAVESIVRQVGICCFSELRDSILMWSHYAKEHKGICIGFDTSKSFFRFAWEVIYQEEFPVVRRPTDSNEDVLAKTLLTKASCWSYEKEWRIARRTLTNAERSHRLLNRNYSEEDRRLVENENGPGYYSFPKESITEVYLGARMEKADRDRVVQGVRDAGLDIQIFEAKRNPKMYCLEFNLISTK
jgi:hypothetical protein